jgi:AcrR family transcriptional regulator
MARIVKEYAVRRDEILDVAQRLVFSKGYEHMTIQDILDDLQIAKGTFYYYFDSKQSLLEAFIERLWNAVEQQLNPIVDDPQLPALEKLQRLYFMVNSWKNQQRAYLLALFRGWYADENALVREKMRVMGAKWVAPLLSKIIQQGIREGVMRTAYPELVGALVLSLGQELGDALGRLLLTSEVEHYELRQVEDTVAVYTDAVERVLGIPGGSLTLVEDETIKQWFSPVGPLSGDLI